MCVRQCTRFVADALALCECTCYDVREPCVPPTWRAQDRQCNVFLPQVVGAYANAMGRVFAILALPVLTARSSALAGSTTRVRERASALQTATVSAPRAGKNA